MRRLLLLCLLAACGAREESPPPPRLLRLWERPAQLATPPAAPPREALRIAPEAGTPVAFPPRGQAELVRERRAEGGQEILRLTGAHGGLLQVVPVEPSTTYVFRGELRTLALAGPGARARLWTAEAQREDVPLSELVRARTNVHALPAVQGDTPWHEVRAVFTTAPETRYLYVLVVLGEGEVTGGAAEFRALALEPRDPHTLWLEQLALARTQDPEQELLTQPWQRERRLVARLGGEHRPSFVLLPGERLRFELPARVEPARLSFAFGAWLPALGRPAASAGTLSVAADGQPLAREPVALARREAELFWQPLELALPPGARTLEFAAEGDAPLVVGAPLVRTSAPRAAGPSVLLVSLDTLRADFVGAYGSTRGLTPNLDRLAAEGLLCADASASSPYTLPSHATMLTGQQPSVHGVTDHGRRLTSARSRSLAEVLAEAGCATQAFTSGGFLNAEFGLTRGFDGFAVIDPLRADEPEREAEVDARHGARVAGVLTRLRAEHGPPALERWLRAHADERFFLFVHSYSVHDYVAPAELLACAELGCTQPEVPLLAHTPEEAAAFTPEMRAHLVHRYEAALRHADRRVGELLALLDELGRSADTLVVVTSDHGEEFFERGFLQHGGTLHEEILRVPLLFRGPGIAPGVLTRPAMLADLAPTILARLGLPAFAQAQGVDLLGPRWPERAVWAEVEDGFAWRYARRSEAGLKSVHGPERPGLIFPSPAPWQHFDLARDPAERAPLASDDPRLAAARQELERQREQLETLGAALGELGAATLDDATRAELDALGYGGLTR